MRFFRFKNFMSMDTIKYLRYAIGEIILVVVGILIALQVNNYNEELNNKKLEKKYRQLYEKYLYEFHKRQ